jgi:hypothetical protein
MSKGKPFFFIFIHIDFQLPISGTAVVGLLTLSSVNAEYWETGHSVGDGKAWLENKIKTVGMASEGKVDFSVCPFTRSSDFYCLYVNWRRQVTLRRWCSGNEIIRSNRALNQPPWLKVFVLLSLFPLLPSLSQKISFTLYAGRCNIVIRVGCTCLVSKIRWGSILCLKHIDLWLRN